MKFGRLARYAVLATSTLGAMMTPAYADQSEQEPELIALSDAWIDAEVGRDTSALERLLDERFLATFASGQTIDRAGCIAWVQKSDIKPFQVRTKQFTFTATRLSSSAWTQVGQSNSLGLL